MFKTLALLAVAYLNSVEAVKISNTNQGPIDDEIDKLMSKFDLDGSGTITWPEVKKALGCKGKE